VNVARFAFFSWALAICPLFMWGLIEVIVEMDSGVWVLVLGVPALLTVTVGVLAKRPGGEIALAAFLSAGLSALAILLTFLYAIHEDGFS
jgi:hypothetical protein